MKIGFVVDGDAEFASLHLLYDRLQPYTLHTLLRPIRADVQPGAPAGLIADRIVKKAPALLTKGVDLLVLLIDREQRQECPGQWAAEIMQELVARWPPGLRSCRYAVIVKDWCYENWLISDTDVFMRMRGRFDPARVHKRDISPNKADRTDAQKILKTAAIRRAYDKRGDAVSIMNSANPQAMAANSRSFRKFLREIGVNAYRDQSRVPVVSQWEPVPTTSP